MNNVIDLVLYDDAINNFKYFDEILQSDDIQGEKKLAIAVLLYGVIDYFDTKKDLKNNATNWFFANNDESWPFSFENICFILKFDPNNFRKNLKNMENHEDLPQIVKKLKRLNPTTGTRNKIR